MTKILLIEDDNQLGKTLTEQLSEKKYQVIWHKNVTEHEKNEHIECDLAIVDLNLPDGSGFDIIKTLQMPVVIMTALNTPENRLHGLELGAYDFIPKPFLFKEVLLKIEKLLEKQVKLLVLSSGITIDLKGRTIESKEGDITFLNEREFTILKLLIQKSPNVVSRDDILNELKEEDSASHRGIDNIIVKLRQILKDEGHLYINSVRGIGYQWYGDKK